MKLQHWSFGWGLSECPKVFAESLVIVELFVPFLLILEKQHKNIVYI